MFSDDYWYDLLKNSSKSKGGEALEITKLKLEVVNARKDSDEYRTRLNKTLALLKTANDRIAALEAEKGTLQLTIESQTVIITTLNQTK